eukprot:3397034-Rhodomonas_salina.1
MVEEAGALLRHPSLTSALLSFLASSSHPRAPAPPSAGADMEREPADMERHPAVERVFLPVLAAVC